MWRGRGGGAREAQARAGVANCEGPRVRGARPTQSVARAVAAAAAARRAGRLGLGASGLAAGVALRSGRIGGLGRGLAVLAVGLLGRLARALEIGGVPAAALELKADRGDQLGERPRLALGTVRQRRLGELLQHFQFMAAGAAAVFIDRHLVAPLTSKGLMQNDKYSRIWGLS